MSLGDIAPAAVARVGSKSGRVYDELRSAIISLKLQPGAQIDKGDICERLGVSRQTVNAIETEKYDPSLPLAFRIARLFGTEIERIFADEDR